MQLVVLGPVVVLQFGNVRGPRFADQHRSIFIRGASQFAHHVVNFGQFLVVFLLHVGPAEFVRSRKDRIVREFGIFKKRVHRIQPESRDAALVPESRHVQHRLFHRRIAPVQVRLLRIKVVVVILIGLRIELPRRQPKRRKPVVGRLPRPLAVAPDKPVTMLGSLRRFGILEPLVLIRGVIHHKIQNHSNVALLTFAHQVIEILHRSVHRINRLIVRHVVSEIHLRRRETRRDPDGVHAEILQVIQFRGDAVQVADPIVVAVRKTARVNLVKHRVLPPRVPLAIHFLLLRPPPGGGCAQAQNQYAHYKNFSKQASSSLVPRTQHGTTQPACPYTQKQTEVSS